MTFYTFTKVPRKEPLSQMFADQPFRYATKSGDGFVKCKSDMEVAGLYLDCHQICVSRILETFEL